MPRRLVVAGLVIVGVGLAMLAYLDPVIRILIFGFGGSGNGGIPVGATSFTRTGSFAGNFTAGAGAAATRTGGTISMVSVATIIVFAVTVIGLLLAIAGSFATGKPMSHEAGPSPAAT